MISVVLLEPLLLKWYKYFLQMLTCFQKNYGLNGNKYSQGAASCHSFAHQIPAIFKNGSVHGQAPKSFEKQ